MLYTVAKLTEELNRYDDNAQVILAIYQYRGEIGKVENDHFLEHVERLVDEEGQTYIRLWCFNDLDGN